MKKILFQWAMVRIKGDIPIDIVIGLFVVSLMFTKHTLSGCSSILLVFVPGGVDARNV